MDTMDALCTEGYPLTVTCAFTETGLSAYSNPYELLTDGVDAALLDRLWCTPDGEGNRRRAEDRRRASDYEAFAALCRAMPRWAGHPVYAAMHGVLSDVMGRPVTMEPASAPVLWRVCATRLWEETVDVHGVLHRMGERQVSASLPAVCTEEDTDRSAENGLTVRPVLCLDDVVGSPDRGYARRIMGEGDDDMFVSPDVLGSHLIAAVEQVAACGGCARITLPPEWKFERPHPYRAGAILARLQAGEAVTETEAFLLTAQLLRVTGQAMAKHGVSLTVRGGRPAEVHRLLTYLQGCHGLCSVIYAPVGETDMAATAAWVGDFDGVTVGLAVESGDALAALAARWQSFANHLPVGAVACVDLPVACDTDLRTAKAAARALCALWSQWAKDGLGPVSTAVLQEILHRL